MLNLHRDNNSKAKTGIVKKSLSGHRQDDNLRVGGNGDTMRLIDRT